MLEIYVVCEILAIKYLLVHVTRHIVSLNTYLLRKNNSKGCEEIQPGEMSLPHADAGSDISMHL